MTGPFHHRIFHFRPSRPRHLLGRIAFALIGVLLALLLLAGSVFIGLGMLAWHFGRKLRRPAAVPAGAGVIEGECRVLEPRALPQRTAPGR